MRGAALTTISVSGYAACSPSYPRLVGGAGNVFRAASEESAMKAVLRVVAICEIAFVAGMSSAVAGEALTKDEKVLTMAVRLEMLENLHNANVRRTSVAGQK